MKWVLVPLLALAAHAAQSPVQKVLGLLKEMNIKSAAAIETAKAQHDEYSAFCKKTLSEKQQAIEEGKDRIERLQADIEKFGASVTTLTSDIQTHTKEIATAQQDTEKTSALRDQELADYESTLKEYEDSIGALPFFATFIVKIIIIIIIFWKWLDFTPNISASWPGAIGKALELLKAQGGDVGALLEQLPRRVNQQLEAFLQTTPKAKPKKFGGEILGTAN